MVSRPFLFVGILSQKVDKGPKSTNYENIAYYGTISERKGWFFHGKSAAVGVPDRTQSQISGPGAFIVAIFCYGKQVPGSEEDGVRVTKVLYPQVAKQIKKGLEAAEKPFTGRWTAAGWREKTRR